MLIPKPPGGALVNGKQWFNYTDKVDVTPYGQADPLALADIMDGVIDTTPENMSAHGSLNFGVSVDGTSGIGFSTSSSTGGIGLLSAHNRSYDQGQNPVVRGKLRDSVVMTDSPREKVDTSTLSVIPAPRECPSSWY